MASHAAKRGPIEEEVAQHTGQSDKQGDVHQDVEAAPEMIDLDRIERVYKYEYY